MTGDGPAANEDFSAGFGVGSVAVRDGTGDEEATGFDVEFKADAEGPPFLLAVLALLELVEVAGSAVRALDEFEFLLVAADKVFRLFAFEFLFDSETVMVRGTSRLELDDSDGRSPGTVKTMSKVFECCSTCAVTPG